MQAKTLKGRESTSPTMVANKTKNAAREGAGSSKTSSRNLTINAELQQPDLNSDDIHQLRGRVGLLERDLERRQESYIARERAYKTRIEELEQDIANERQQKTGWMKADNKMSKLKSMQVEA